VPNFNIREGLKIEDDQFPSRLHREFLKTGHSIKQEELDFMRADYYRLRGWDENGRSLPSPEVNS